MLAFDNDLMFEGSMIPKGTKLTTSPSHKGNRYMAGVNANVVWLGDWGTTEDAFVVSDKFAEKCENIDEAYQMFWKVLPDKPYSSINGLTQFR